MQPSLQLLRESQRRGSWCGKCLACGSEQTGDPSRIPPCPWRRAYAHSRRRAGRTSPRTPTGGCGCAGCRLPARDTPRSRGCGAREGCTSDGAPVTPTPHLFTALRVLLTASASPLPSDGGALPPLPPACSASRSCPAADSHKLCRPLCRGRPITPPQRSSQRRGCQITRPQTPLKTRTASNFWS